MSNIAFSVNHLFRSNEAHFLIFKSPAQCFSIARCLVPKQIFWITQQDKGKFLDCEKQEHYTFLAAQPTLKLLEFLGRG